jgi:hypothetical protein
MELSKVSRGIQSMPQQELSKHSKIVRLLSVFGIRRQAKLDTEDYLVFATDLESCDLTVIETALNLLSSKPRAEGQTAFPDVATILEAVRGVIRARRPTVEQEAADRWLRYIAAAKAEGVTEPDREILGQIETLNGKYNLTKPKVIDTTPVMQACPHCSQELPVGPNIRFWTPEELRAYADVLERNQAIAAANRAAMMEQQAVPAEELM